VVACVIVTELAREQPVDGSFTNAKSNNASVVVSANNTGVLPSPDVLNSLDMIHSWLQQSERQADDQSMSVGLTHTSVLPTARVMHSQSKLLPVSTSSWHTPIVNAGTVSCCFGILCAFGFRCFEIFFIIVVFVVGFDLA